MRTVRVFDLTLIESSWSLAYMRGVQGSTVLGNLEEMIEIIEFVF